MALRIRVMPALHLADPPPVERRRIAVLLVTGHHAALAADALRHIEVKTILLAGSQGSRRDERCGLDLDSYQRPGNSRKQCALHERKRRHASASLRYTGPVSATRAPSPN